ncbi:MAG: preprotein translocase subunit SecG [Alphaproteobacteria bacterium]
MTTILLVIHIILALGLTVTVLLQRSEGGALGIGGGQGGMMTSRGQASLLTRATAVLATLFMINCLVLAILAGASKQPRSIFDAMPTTQPALPSTAPAVPVAPSAPSPSVPSPSAPAQSTPAPGPAAPPTR